MANQPITHQHREIWRTKPALRTVYGDYHRRMLAASHPGSILEIGGGSGHLKESYPDVISLDVQIMPWLDLVADAHALPFAENSFDNLLMLDVLHHLPRPDHFLEQALKVLRPGGRLILMEPAITPLSWIFYKFFHHEPANMGIDPLGDDYLSGSKPEDSNQAIPTLLFGRHRRRLLEMFPRLEIRKIEHLSLWAFPLTGGFQPWCLLPRKLVSPLLKLEDFLLPILGRVAGFRLFVVIERKP